MLRWRRFRTFLALGADVIGVAIGLGVIMAAIVGLWNQASLHLAQPWLTMILLGVFLLVAGLAGRGLRYLPVPNSNWSNRDEPTPPVAAATSKASQEEAITSDLLRLVTERLGDIPLRHSEIEIVLLVLRDAISSLDNIPFTGTQPGNEATDIKFTGQRRGCTDPLGGEQMWHLPTTKKGWNEGIVNAGLKVPSSRRSEIPHLRTDFV